MVVRGFSTAAYYLDVSVGSKGCSAKQGLSRIVQLLKRAQTTSCTQAASVSLVVAASGTKA
jgi:hypothetical protein